MSTWKVLYSHRPQCPACKWTDWTDETQLKLVEKWANQWGFGHVVECSECGRVTQVTHLWGQEYMTALDCERTVPTRSIIPF